MDKISYFMNWDWDKLQEKRRHQPKDGSGKGKKNSDQQDEFNNFADFENDNEPAFGRGNGNNNNGQRPRNPRTQMPNFDFSNLKIPALKWIILAFIVLWLASGIYIVRPDESGVVLRFGAYTRTVSEGLHYHLPFPMEKVYLPKVSQIRQTEVGFRSQRSGTSFQQGQFVNVDEESAMLTGDENIVNAQFSIQYHIKPDGAVDYLFNVTQPDAVVKKAAEAAMREIIGKTSLDAALTRDRIKIQDDVTSLLQSILDRYQVGVQVVAVQMQDVQPPMEVRESFKDVASAREDKERLTNEAEAYRRDILPKAQGSAATLVNQAEAYKQTRIRNAEGESSRFTAVLKEYQQAKNVTKKRLLFETLEQILSQPSMEKVILPAETGKQIIPLLPLGNSGKISQNITPSTGIPQSIFSTQSTADAMNQNSPMARPSSRGTR